MIKSAWARDEQLAVSVIAVSAVISIFANILVGFGVPYMPMRFTMYATASILVILAVLYAVIKYQGERRPLILLLIAAFLYTVAELLSLDSLNGFGLQITGLGQSAFNRMIRSSLRDAATCLAILTLVCLFITASQRTAEVEDRQRRLRRSESQYRQLVELTPNWIFRVDAAGRLTFTNHSGAAFLGYSPDEMVGRPLEAFLYPDEHPRVQAVLEEVRNGRRKSGVEFRCLGKDGQTCWVSFHLDPTTDADSMFGVHGDGHDVTARKRAEEALQSAYDDLDKRVQARTAEVTAAKESLEREIAERIQVETALRESEAVARALLNAPTDSVLLLDAEFTVLDLNQTAAQKLGRPAEELIGLRTTDFLPADVAQRRNANLKHVLQTGTSCRFEDQRAGIWFDVVYFPVHDEFGKVTKVAVVGRDITEQKRSEQALRESEGIARALLNAPTDSVLLLDAELTVLDLNQTAAQRLGRPAEELIGLHTTDLLPADVAERRNTYLKQVLQTGMPCRFEDQNAGIWYDIVHFPVRDESGMVTKLAIVGRDITERKRSEQALRESEAKFRVLAETAPAAIFIYRGGPPLFVNSALERMTGYSRDELLAMNSSAVAHPDFYAMVSERTAARLRGEDVPTRYEARIVTKNGESRWVDVAADRIDFDGQPAVIAMLYDITERKRAEELLRQAHDQLEHRVAVRTAELSEANRRLRDEIAEREKVDQALRASEEKFRIKYRNNPIPTFSWQKRGEDFILVDHNDAAVDFTHGRVSGFLGRTDAQMYADVPQIREDLRRCFAEKTIIRREMVYRFQASPETRDLIATYVPIPPDLVMVHTDDITERKRAQEAIRKREQLYRDALQVAGAVPYYRRYTEDSASDPYEFMGDEIRTLTGYGPEEFTVGLWRSITREIQVLGDLKSLAPNDAIQRARSGKGVSWRADYRVQTRSGEEKWLADAAVQVHDERGILVGSLGILQDLTERRHAEDQARKHLEEMAHVQRVSTMGQMASELAHELNQPLGAVVNYTRGCVRRMQTGDWNSSELLEVMEDAASEALRAGRIVGSIAGFLKKKEMHRSRVSVNDVVQEAVDLAKIDARRSDVAIRLALDAQQPTAMADAIQIEQVVLNLALNAIEALSATEPGRRNVVIQTSLDPEEKVLVAVRDTGPGLSPEAVGKVFDPFFTTKPDGLGVGLSISRSIVEAHEGRLWVESNEDGGCTFKFTLPGMR